MIRPFNTIHFYQSPHTLWPNGTDHYKIWTSWLIIYVLTLCNTYPFINKFTLRGWMYKWKNCPQDLSFQDNEISLPHQEGQSSWCQDFSHIS